MIARLGGVDGDVGRAIVSLVERKPRSRRAGSRAAELSNYGNHAVIVVTPVKALKKIAGVQLVPIGNGRSLIALAQPNTIPQLELHLRDAIDQRDIEPAERHALEQIAQLLRESRHSAATALEERTIIVLASKRQRRPRAD